MAYIQFDPTKPDPTVDNGTTACANIRLNEQAIRDGNIIGGFPGWNYAQSGGTSEEPAIITHTKGTETLRQSISWSGGNVSQIITEYQPNTATALSAVGTAILSYSGADLVGVSGGSGFFFKLMALFGKVKSTRADLTTHASIAGTGVHGLGSISVQNASSVNISGGLISNTPISGAAGTFTIERETFINQAFTAGANTLTASACGWIECSLPASGTVTISDILGLAPSLLSGGVIVSFVTSGTLPTIVWAGNIKWPNNVAPTFTASSNNLCTFMSRNGTNFWFGSYSGAYA